MEQLVEQMSQKGIEAIQRLREWVEGEHFVGYRPHNPSGVRSVPVALSAIAVTLAIQADFAYVFLLVWVYDSLVTPRI